MELRGKGGGSLKRNLLKRGKFPPVRNRKKDPVLEYRRKKK